jgi:hypothetical protein
MIEARCQYRRVNGHPHLPALRTAVDRHIAALHVATVRHDDGPVIAADDHIDRHRSSTKSDNLGPGRGRVLAVRPSPSSQPEDHSQSLSPIDRIQWTNARVDSPVLGQLDRGREFHRPSRKVYEFGGT